MEKVLNKIADIIDDMSRGIFLNDERDFLRGYIFALIELGEIDNNEALMLLKFYDRLVDDKNFIVKGA